MNADASYTAKYTWVRGTELEDGTSLGNTITSNRNVNINSALNLETLYNHIPFLKKVNDRFKKSASTKKNANNKQNTKKSASPSKVAANQKSGAKDSVKVKRDIETEWWYKPAQSVARLLMMVRSVNISYRTQYSMLLPGFMPNVGDMLGQNKSGGALAPGLDFAFGLMGDGYIDKAMDRGWMLNNDNVSTPANINMSKDLYAT